MMTYSQGEPFLRLDKLLDDFWRILTYDLAISVEGSGVKRRVIMLYLND